MYECFKKQSNTTLSDCFTVFTQEVIILLQHYYYLLKSLVLRPKNEELTYYIDKYLTYLSTALHSNILRELRFITL